VEREAKLPENNAPGFRGKWSIGFDLYSTRSTRGRLPFLLTR
jgi:hypothetical protein